MSSAPWVTERGPEKYDSSVVRHGTGGRVTY